MCFHFPGNTLLMSAAFTIFSGFVVGCSCCASINSGDKRFFNFNVSHSLSPLTLLPSLICLSLFLSLSLSLSFRLFLSLSQLPPLDGIIMFDYQLVNPIFLNKPNAPPPPTKNDVTCQSCIDIFLLRRAYIPDAWPYMAGEGVHIKLSHPKISYQMHTRSLIWLEIAAEIIIDDRGKINRIILHQL